MLKIANKKALVVAISGGSGSGKTTIAHRLRQYMPEGVKSVVIYQDNYYLDQKEVPLVKRMNSNYDTPNAFDWKLMTRDLEALKNKRAIDSPVYDFTNHTRSDQKEHIEPVDVVIFEGFMSLHSRILHLSDIRIFVDTPSDERLLRRMMRDIKERKRSFESIANQWRTTVRPMYRAHVAPQKEVAHIIIPWYEISSVAIKAIKGSIVDFLNAPDDGVVAYTLPANGFVGAEGDVSATVEGAAHASEEVILLKHDAPIAVNDDHGNPLAGEFASRNPVASPLVKQRPVESNRFKRHEGFRQQSPRGPAPAVAQRSAPLPPKPVNANGQRAFQNSRPNVSSRPVGQQQRTGESRTADASAKSARVQNQPDRPNRPAPASFKGQPHSAQGRQQNFRQEKSNQPLKPRPVSTPTEKGGTEDDNGTDRGF